MWGKSMILILSKTCSDLTLTDCHIRVGGAAGTSLTSLECPITQLKPLEACKAGSALLHLTPSASAYIENFWAWVADHDIDDSKPWSDTNDLVGTMSIGFSAPKLIVPLDTDKYLCRERCSDRKHKPVLVVRDSIRAFSSLSIQLFRSEEHICWDDSDRDAILSTHASTTGSIRKFHRAIQRRFGLQLHTRG